MNSWLQEKDRSAAKRESVLHMVIETLRRYVGHTEVRRSKGVRDLKTNIRAQLPTCHVLPPRRKALEHALIKGLISDEEYAAGISEPTHQPGDWPDDGPVASTPAEIEALMTQDP